MNRRTIKVPRFQLPKLPWKGFLAVCFLIFFLLGILAANWVGQEKLIQYGMLNDYYVGQLAYTDLDMDAYFVYILKRRIRVFGMAALLVYTRFGILALVGIICWYAFSLGYLFVNALVSMGFGGMILVLLSVFPQIICYAAAYFGLAKKLFGKSVENVMPVGIHRVWKNPQMFLLISALICMVAGIWLESYINPVLLKWYISRI